MKLPLFRKIRKSLKIKLSLWIALSLLISASIGILISNVLKPIIGVNVRHVDYDKDKYETQQRIMDFINDFYTSTENKDAFIKRRIRFFDGNTYIVSADGKVKYKDERNGYGISTIDINDFRKQLQYSDAHPSEFKAIYPFNIDKEMHYIIEIKQLHGVVSYTHETSYIVGAVIGFLIFVLLIYMGINKKVKYIEYISSSIKEISKGNLDYDLKLQGKDELATVSSEINNMEKNLKRMVHKESESDRKQKELITNISHDLKTPFTIILGYLDIIRTGAYKSEEEKTQNIETSYEKAQLLQKMVLKLFELVKLNNNEITLNKSEVDINKLLMQVITDYSAIADEKNIKINYEGSDKALPLNIDIDKMCRVFNNLLNNAVKYSECNTKINVTLKKDMDGALISFRNKCDNLTEDDVEHIFDRFYRGDKARNSSVEGSGIGLSIVKSIIELHNSSIWAELHDGEIWFIMRLRG